MELASRIEEQKSGTWARSYRKQVKVRSQSIFQDGKKQYGDESRDPDQSSQSDKHWFQLRVQ